MNFDLLRKMKISQRLFLGVCLFSLPMAVLFYFNLDQLSANIAFATQEIEGNEYQSTYVRLLKALGEYQVAKAGGNASSAEERVNHFFEEAGTHGKLEPDLHFTDVQLKADGMDSLQLSSLKAKWEALKSSSPKKDGTPAEFAALVSDIRGVISHAGDTSDLTLDPEMDSYYMADLTSVCAAQTLSRISTLTIYTQPRLTGHTLKSDERTQIAIFAASLKEGDIDRIVNDVDTALSENLKAKRGVSPTLKTNLDKVYGRYKTASQDLLAALDTLSKGEPMDAAKFQGVTNEASEASLDLWQTAVSELTVLLNMRIESYAHYRLKLILGTLLALAIATVVFYFTIRQITVPIGLVAAQLDRISNGDLSGELSGVRLDRGDEVGLLARATQAMCGNLKEMIREIAGGIHVLASSSNELIENSTQMTAESQRASDKAHSVAAAAEQMTANIASVATGIHQTNFNLEQVTSATTQMTSAISDIGRSSERARGITDQATIQAQEITKQIGYLEDAAREIGKVTQSITEISSQTNLLALNATIEAARAGAAGKGFAVVAAEIKALAQQTATATQDIKARIDSVQSATASGITEVGKVSGVISDVRAIVITIAAAIEQQSQTTAEISRSIASAAREVNDANHRVVESSQVSREIAQDIVQVDRAAGELAGGSDHVRSSAAEVSLAAERLGVAIAKFKA